MSQNCKCTVHFSHREVRPLFFAKLFYEPSLPEISENLNKNKNEIPVFFIPSDPRKGSGFRNDRKNIK